MTRSDFLTLLPQITLVTWAMVLLLVDLWIPVQRKGITALLAVIGLVVTLGLNLSQIGQSRSAFNGMAVVDGFSVFLNTIFLASGIAGITLAYDYLKRMGLERGEYYVLLLFSISGMMLMTQANDLIMVFLALELLSIPLYILSGFARPRPESEESALKYFLLGSFASGFVLYGVALVYGATGSTGLPAIFQAVKAGGSDPLLFLAGASLLIIGLGFKVAVVPFHTWVPDVYQGAPSPVTGFMSVSAKAAGFAALLRVFVMAFPGLAVDLHPVLWTLSALTMLVGNLVAIAQSNIKRMLAYSSIANAGYILMAFASYGNAGISNNVVASILFYLMAYTLTNLGAWAVVVAVEKAENTGLEIADYAGLGRKYPLLGAAMLIFMLSFTGLPPTLGFWGKFYLFQTAIEGGDTALAGIGLLATLISAYYYLRVVVGMYMKQGDPEIRRDLWLNLTAIIAALATLLLGLVPGSLFNLALEAVMKLL
jgi:NADH-quinone oxidoreductase subunit N